MWPDVTVAELVGNPTNEFSVVFNWKAADVEGRAAWSEQTGVTRWDFVSVEDGRATGGRFLILSSESGAGQACVWAQMLERKEDVYVTCTSASRPYGVGAEVWRDALAARARPSETSVQIAGRQARCFALVADGPDGEICVDAGIPLRIAVGGQDFEAISAALGSPPLDAPLEGGQRILRREVLSLPRGLDE